ncbi:MAG: hypothetical protein V3R52_04760 [Candidatus Neomarinimicrobiota bacterium]
MKYLLNIALILIFTILASCVKPVKIVIPDSMQSFPAMSVIGTEDSWKIDFGGFHAYDIKDRDSRILLTDARNTSYDIKSFEFIMTTAGGTQYECYCEFPMKSLDDETFRCVFQNVYNQFDVGKLTDESLSTFTGDLTIEGYFEYEGKTSGSKKILVGYLFKEADNNIGLVDVSKINEETVWIDPMLDLHKQIMVAAGATSIILKHRKWYEGFYQNLDREGEDSFLTDYE